LEAILAAKLARVVDRLLDDPAFIQPFRVHFDTRLAGGMPDGASRLISLHDPDVGPLREGRIGPPGGDR
jgi:IS5 family transposase